MKSLDQNWRVPPGGQLSFDLPPVENSAQPPDPFTAFELEFQAQQLLRKLARDLGRQRAAIDIAAFRAALVNAPGSTDP